jgi:hypothetical protein
MSSYGWTYLSRDALRRAEHQLSGTAHDVRDEVGFLIVHQRYADYFFPGTSVLHTHIRYALFVPWIYQTLYDESVSGRAQDRVKQAEIDLAGRLKHLKGAIGGANYPKATSQPPSFSYWGALGAWGILRESDGRLPSRAQVNAMLQSKHRRATDDDGQALSRAELPFIALPRCPDNWSGTEPMTFKLLSREALFLHRQLTDLRPRDFPHHRCLLAKLASGPRIEGENCWSAGIGQVATDDATKLRRAGYAASLAAVGRAVYAAMVETLKEEEDHQTVSRTHRDNLPLVLEDHAGIATRLKMADLTDDIGTIPSPVEDVLVGTLEWLDSGANDFMSLRDPYENAERYRKQSRARLSRVFGGPRRLEWDNDKHALAQPLHYRWKQVSGLLSDLWDAA